MKATCGLTFNNKAFIACWNIPGAFQGLTGFPYTARSLERIWQLSWLGVHNQLSPHRTCFYFLQLRRSLRCTANRGSHPFGDQDIRVGVQNADNAKSPIIDAEVNCCIFCEHNYYQWFTLHSHGFSSIYGKHLVNFLLFNLLIPRPAR